LFIVETDASNFAVGAVLSQEIDGKLHSVGFISSNLTKSQRNNPIYAIKVALEQLRHFIKGVGHPFIIYTDHKNLTFTRKPEMLSHCQIRWYEFLSRFDFNLFFRAGKKSGKSDLLSRRNDHLFNYEFIFSCRFINCLTINNDRLTNSILNTFEHNEFYNFFRTSLSINNFDIPKIKNIDKFVIDKE